MALPAYDPPVVNGVTETYWSIVHKDAVTLFDKVASDQVFGVRNCRNDHSLRLLKQLNFYLNIIEEERHWDKLNDPYAVDRGNAYYMEINCIKSIRHALICRGFNKSIISTLFEAFSIYNLVDPTSPTDMDGIGYMGVEAETGKINRVSND